MLIVLCKVRVAQRLLQGALTATPTHHHAPTDTTTTTETTTAPQHSPFTDGLEGQHDHGTHSA